MKWFSSLLAAVGIYAGLLAAVLYSYAHYHSRSAVITTEKSRIITLGIVGESGQHTATSHKPKADLPATPKEKKHTKEKTVADTLRPSKIPTPSVAKRTQKSTPRKVLAAKTVAKKVIAEKVIEKPLPVTPPKKLSPQKAPAESKLSADTPPIHLPLSPVDPKQALALKTIPETIKHIVQPQKKTKTKQSSKTGKSKTAHKRRSKKTQRGHRASKKKGDGSGHRRRQGGNARRFLAQLKQRINRHNHYPRSAERRRLQGRVQASFTILPNGGVTAISIRGADAFHAAARRAVQGAFPVNPSKAGHRLPWRITVTLRYRLKST